MNRNLSITTLLGITGILFGAFGAHALKEVLTIDALQNFETAVRYQMYHVVVLLFVNTYTGFSNKIKNLISLLFFMAILFFSGSIYAITVGKIDPKFIWFVTPLGGLLFISGWFIMFLNFLKKR